MTVKNPYVPPSYGVRNLAIERRIAGKPPASLAQEKQAEDEAKPAPKKGKK